MCKQNVYVGDMFSVSSRVNTCYISDYNEVTGCIRHLQSTGDLNVVCKMFLVCVLNLTSVTYLLKILCFTHKVPTC
jgi:hypothetical protein